MQPKRLHLFFVALISLLALSASILGAADTDANSDHKNQPASQGARVNHETAVTSGELFSNCSTEMDTFVWHYEADAWWSLDKQRIEIKADAIVTVIDPQRFEETFNSVESALTRIDDIVPPAIRNAITSQRKKDLVEVRAAGNDWFEIRPALIEDISRVYSPYLKRFGMDIAHLVIMLR